MTEWALFTQSLLHDFGPPICHNTTGDLAPPKHTGTVDDYVNNFTAYVLHVGIASKLHQVHLFTTDLQDPLQAAVACHHPQEMETAINLARTLQHLPPTTVDAKRATPDIATDSDHTPRWEADVLNDKMDQEWALPFL